MKLNLCARADVAERWPELAKRIGTLISLGGYADDALLWRLDYTDSHGIALILERWDGDGPRTFWVLACPFAVQQGGIGDHSESVEDDCAQFFARWMVSRDFTQAVIRTLATPVRNVA